MNFRLREMDEVNGCIEVDGGKSELNSARLRDTYAYNKDRHLVTCYNCYRKQTLRYP